MSLNKFMVLRGNQPIPKTTTMEMSIRLVLLVLALSIASLEAERAPPGLSVVRRFKRRITAA